MFRKMFLLLLFAFISVSAFARWPISECNAFSQILDEAWDDGNGDDDHFRDLLNIYDANC